MLRACFTILCSLLSVGLLAQDSLALNLQALMRFYEANDRFAGSVLVAKKGKVILETGYGMRNAALSQRNDAQSIHAIYSITKTFTATVILQLVEQNKLSLTDKLSHFYPGYPSGDSITIKHLLTHTSGLYNYTEGNTMPDQTEASFVAFERTKPLDFSPGTSWNYSNSGYYFLGYIIQKVTGKTFEEVVTEQIFKPLQMTHSGFALKHLNDSNKAIGYAIYRKANPVPAEVYEPPGPFAAGGIYSTVSDLYNYYLGLRAHKLLSAAMQEKAYKPFKNNYGYGWMTTPLLDKQAIGHGGGGAGFRTSFLQVLEDDVCIIVLSNTEVDVQPLTNGIAKVIYAKPYKIPVPVRVAPAILQEYTGAYRVNEQLTIYISVRNNQILAQPAGRPPNILYPENNNWFYVEEISGYIHFRRNSQGQVDTLVFQQGGKDHYGQRLKASWGISGSATPHGWDGPDIELSPAALNIFTAKDVVLVEGEIKFRFNNDWTLSFGIEKDNRLSPEGQNIKIAAGRYDLRLDLSDPDKPKYTLAKKP